MTGTAIVSYRQFIEDPTWLGWAFPGPSFAKWKAITIGIMGEPLTPAERAIWHELTGTDREPLSKVDEFLAIVGRRGGKGRAASALALYHATAMNYQNVLAPGERAHVMIMSCIVRQSHRMFSLCLEGLKRTKRLLRKLITRQTRDTIELDNGNSLVIESANARTIRGASCSFIAIDELAHLLASEFGINDVELYNAARPSLANLGGILGSFTTPHAKVGITFSDWNRWGDNHDQQFICIKEPSLSMNPILKESIVRRAFENDAQVAASEWGSIEAGIQFRDDLASFIDIDLVRPLVMDNVQQIPYNTQHTYNAFADPSGGSGRESFTCAISHSEVQGDRYVAVLDYVGEIKGPCKPAAAAREFAEVIKSYGLGTVTSDAYAGDWPTEAWASAGITCIKSEKSKSQIYVECLPAFHDGTVRLLDNKRLVAQLCALERRTAKNTGRPSVDHPQGGRDDVCNAACGSLLLSSVTMSGAQQWAKFGDAWEELKCQLGLGVPSLPPGSPWAH